MEHLNNVFINVDDYVRNIFIYDNNNKKVMQPVLSEHFPL